MSRKYLIPAILALCSTGAFAQTTTSSTRFVDVDTDDDGAISQTELVAAGLDTRLANADTDKNGTLSLTEYEAGMQTRSINNTSSSGLESSEAYETNSN